MRDVTAQLGAYQDHLDMLYPAVTVDETAALSPVVVEKAVPLPRRRRSGAFAFAAAFVAVVAAGAVAYLWGGAGGEAMDPAPVVDDTAPVVTEVRDGAMSEGVESLLACLPLDPTGWSRLSSPAPSAAGGEAPLVANDDTVVAIGETAAYWSHDGVEWHTVEDFPGVGFVGDFAAASEKGFLVVGASGRSYKEGSCCLGVLFSEDGTTWRQIEPESLPVQESRWRSDLDFWPRISSVSAGPDGFFILGSGETAVIGDTTVEEDWEDSKRFALFSADGLTWNWMHPQLPTEQGEPLVVVAAESGWTMAFGMHAESPRAGSTAVWESTDGATWRENTARDAPPALAFWGNRGMLVDGDTWVLAASDWISASPGDTAVWVSIDGGVSWNEHLLGSKIYDIAATPAGLLVTGDSRLHYSQDDGATWQQCTVSSGRMPEFEQVAVLGETLIMSDSATGAFYVWTDPGAAP